MLVDPKDISQAIRPCGSGYTPGYPTRVSLVVGTVTSPHWAGYKPGSQTKGGQGIGHAPSP